MDMLRRGANICQAVAEVGGTVVWSTPKSHERRSVPFPRSLADELSLQMVGKARDALVFTGSKGDVLRVSTFGLDTSRLPSASLQSLIQASPS